MTADATADRLASIRARADAATPGPWVQGCEYDGEWRKIGQPGYGGVITPVSAFHAVSAPSYHYADAEFIAAAREDIPFLLDLLAAAEAKIAQVRDLSARHLRDSKTFHAGADAIPSASPVSALDTVRADERKEWADYFEHWGESVATPEFTQERAVSALRGTKPFGVTAAQTGADDAQS